MKLDVRIKTRISRLVARAPGLFMSAPELPTMSIEGVLAGVVFEDTIRRACVRNKVTQAGVQLDGLITSLEKKGLLSQVEVPRARTSAALLTRATHAQ